MGVGNLGNSLVGLGERRKPGQGRMILLRSFAARKRDMSWQYQWDIEKDFVCLVTMGEMAFLLANGKAPVENERLMDKGIVVKGMSLSR